MNTTIYLYDKPVLLELSRAAESALSRRTAPLFVEVQLIFGCMIAKRVWFRAEAVDGATPVTPMLNVWFRPVRYAEVCGFDAIDNGAVASDFPLVGEHKVFVPDIVCIDYRRGEWVGNFTYRRDALPEPTAQMQPN